MDTPTCPTMTLGGTIMYITIAIYQILNSILEGMDGTKLHGFISGFHTPTMPEFRTLYKKVWAGTVQGATLDDVFSIFNDGELVPSDYEGRSLSINDIVIVDNTIYCCARDGWVVIE